MLQWSFFVISDEQTRLMVQVNYPELCVSWLYYPDKLSIDEYIEDARQVANPKLLSVKDEYASDEALTKLLDSGMYFQIYSVTDEERKV